jgi:FkbM family methyltransferase
VTVRRTLIAARNVVADAGAGVVAHLPFLLPVVRLVGRAVDPVPGVRTVYRRFAESYGGRLRAAGKHHQPVAVGPVAFRFDVTDFTAGPWYFYRHPFEPLTARLLLDVLRPGQTVLDVGANRGFFTMLAAALVGPGGRVHSFEPNPAVMTDLREHVRVNGFADRVTCHPDALSDKADDGAVFYVSTKADNSGLSSLTPGAEALDLGYLSASATTRVRTVPLDEWVAAAGLTAPIDLLKMDVEGAETLVLAGARKTLTDNPPRHLVIETKPDGEAARVLAGYGYRAEVLDRAGVLANVLFTHPTADRPPGEPRVTS